MSRRRGFSLVEVVLAVAVTALVGGSLAIFWSQQVERSRQVRNRVAIEDLLARTLVVAGGAGRRLAEVADEPGAATVVVDAPWRRLPDLASVPERNYLEGLVVGAGLAVRLEATAAAGRPAWQITCTASWLLVPGVARRETLVRRLLVPDWKQEITGQ